MYLGKIVLILFRIKMFLFIVLFCINLDIYLRVFSVISLKYVMVKIKLVKGEML